MTLEQIKLKTNLNIDFCIHYLDKYFVSREVIPGHRRYFAVPDFYVNPEAVWKSFAGMNPEEMFHYINLLKLLKKRASSSMVRAADSFAS